MTDPRPAALVVLAAGQGTRMRSAVPKVLHRLAGRSLLGHVLAAAAPLGAYRTLVVVGHEREQVAAEVLAFDPEARPIDQAEQHGTGHATRLALEAIEVLYDDRPVVVVPGDTPLLTTGTLRALLDAHLAGGGAGAVLTETVADPTGYGRIVRAADSSIAAIVEERDADSGTKAIHEVNAGVYVFTARPLVQALGKLSRENSQGEEYLTDAVGVLRDLDLTVVGVPAEVAGETAGVNDRVQLAAAGAALNARLLDAHMRAGVTVHDPATTWVDSDVVLEADVELLPGTILRGRTVVQRGAVVGPDSNLADTVVRPGAHVQASTCIGAEIGEGASVGPYSYLRPGAKLGRKSKVGAFVEVKASTIGDESKVPHLSYIGDAMIGQRTNVGAATVTANYDGTSKSRTVIGDDVHIGSDTMLVAPVTVGDGASTGAGAVIRADVPPGALAFSENTQRTIDDWAAGRDQRDTTKDEGDTA